MVRKEVIRAYLQENIVFEKSLIAFEDNVYGNNHVTVCSFC